MPRHFLNRLSPGGRVLPLLAILFFIFQFLPTAWADSNVRIVRLSYLNGDVQMDRGDGRGFEKAILNMPVVHGSRIRTREGGQAEIELENGSTVRLVPNSILNVDELSLNGSGDRISRFSLQQGTAYFNVENRHHDVFQVSANHQTLVPRGSSHFRVKADEGALDVAVLKGDVQMSGSAAAEVRIRKGETLTLDSSNAGHYFLAKKIDAEYYDSWDAERRAYREYYTSARSYDNAPYYGLADLNFYGSYLNAAGYGSCWRPSYVPLGWDPFSDGAWVFYPGIGWTFASAYPWGWMPYHYGDWIWSSGTGYCWQPSTRWAQWVAAPVIRPGVYHPIRPPVFPLRPPAAGRNGPTTVIVGAGPTTGTDGPGRNRLLYFDQELARHSPRDIRRAGFAGSAMSPGAQNSAHTAASPVVPNRIPNGAVGVPPTRNNPETAAPRVIAPPAVSRMPEPARVPSAAPRAPAPMAAPRMQPAPMPSAPRMQPMPMPRGGEPSSQKNSK